jgi:hypothetical protein
MLARLSWLDAAQSHNGEVIAAFEENADYALNYAIGGHARDAYAKLGILHLDEVKSSVQLLKNMAKSYYPDPIPLEERLWE